MPDVFISYSRKDEDFVTELVKELEAHERTVWFDRHDIPASQDWWQEICHGIDSSDNFIFIMSPDSLTSKVCNDELAHARQIQKRLIPVKHSEIQPNNQIAPQIEEKWANEEWGDIARANWQELSKFHWITWEIDNDASEKQAELLEVLDTDFEYVRDHRRLLLRAQEWEKHEFNKSYLLSGDELQKAEAWRELSTTRKSKPIKLQLDYIFASRKQQTVRNRNLVAVLSAVSVLMTVLAIISFFSFRVATRRAAENQSIVLALGAQTELDAGFPQRAATLALRANQINNPPQQSQHSLLDVAAISRIQATFNQHTEVPMTAAYTPDGKAIVSAGRDNIAYLWDAQTSEIIYEFTGHTAEITTVTISPNGKYAVTGSRDNTVRAWNLETGELVHIFEEHNDEVQAVAIDSTGQRVFSAGKESKGYLWDIETGEILQELTISTLFMGEVWDAAFHPTQDIVATAHVGGTIHLWDLQTGETISRWTTHGEIATSLAFSPDGQYIVSGGSDNLVIVRDINTEEIVYTLDEHLNVIADVAFSPDGKTFASVSWDKTTIVWDIESGNPLFHFDGHDSVLSCVAYHPQSTAIVTCSADKNILIWDIRPLDIAAIYHGHTRRVWYVDVHPSDDKIASVAEDTHLIIWDLASTEIILDYRNILETVNPTSPALFSPNGDYLAWGTINQKVVITSSDTKDKISTIPTVSSITAFSPDSKKILTGTLQGTLALWDVQTGEQIHQFDTPELPINALFYTQDRIISSHANIIMVWDAHSYELLHRLEEHYYNVTDFAMMSDGATLISVGGTIVNIWQLETGKLLNMLELHTDIIWAVAAHPSEPFIVTGSWDGTLILWNIEQGRAVWRYHGHEDMVMDVKFTHDGSQFISAAGDGRLILWNTHLDQDAMTWLSENRFVAELDCLQRQTYLILPLCD